MEQNELGKRNIYLLFGKYVMPGIVGMIILSLYGIIDGLFVGRTVGAYGIAAMNLVLPYLSIVMAISITITVGGTTYIGIELGKGNKEEIKRVFTQTTITMIIIGMIFTLISFLFCESIAKILGATEATFQYVVEYIKTISPFIIFYMLAILLDLVLRAVGKPIYSMVALIISAILNIILDYIFVVKFLMGTRGAALATGTAFTIGAFIFMIPYFFNGSVVKLIRTKVDLNLIGKILYNGLSEGLTEVSAAIVTFLFNLTLLKYLGELGVSAYSVIGYVCYISTAILIGISDGVKPIISYNYGAQLSDRIKKIFKLSVIVSIVIGMLTISVVDVLGESLIRLFVESDETLIQIAMDGAKLYTLAFLINGINIVTSAYFTSVTKAKESMIVSLARGLIFIPLGLILLPKFLEVKGIWLSVPFAEVITLVISIYLLNRVSVDKV